LDHSQFGNKNCFFLKYPIGPFSTANNLMRALFLLAVLVIVSLAIPNPFESTGRYWWIGGSFTSVSYVNATTGVTVNVPANNFAQWDGYGFDGSLGMGSGVNGAVYKTIGDSCSNIYLGGAFTQANGVTVGPAAVWRPKTKVFQAIGDAGTITWGAGAVVRAIAIDCANVPSGITDCPCDIYLGGTFTATVTTNSVVANNLIKYSFRSKTWDTLSSKVNVLGPVYALYKKGFGITKATDYLYVGGANLNPQGGFAKYNTKTSTWGYDDATKMGTVNGTITSFYYYIPTIKTDQLIAGGEFTWTAGSVVATNIAQFDWSAETITAFPTAGAPSRVNALGYGGGNIVLGGNGPVADPLSYIRKISFDGAAGTYVKISTSQNDVTNIPTPVRDLWVCDTSDCTATSNTGAVAWVGVNNTARFYVKKTDSYVDFGKGSNGEMFCITSAFLVNGATGMTISLIVFIGSFVAYFL
jgi:hypothetical protein